MRTSVTSAVFLIAGLLQADAEGEQPVFYP